LESAIQDPTKFKIKKAQIESYIENNSDIRNLIQENCKEELEDFNQIKEQIFELFKKADLIASKIRETVKKSKLD
jgi:hypothetical protein